MATSKELWSDDFGGETNNYIPFYERMQLLVYSVCV